MAANTGQEQKKPGCVWPILWGVAAVLVTLISAAGVGLAASDSESAGVMATTIAALPFGFVWAGTLGALIMQFAAKDSKPLRYGVPVGCGCLGGLFLLTMIFLFFAAIFPSL